MDEKELTECQENRNAAITALQSACKTITEGRYASEKQMPSVRELNTLRTRVSAFLREMPDTMTIEEILESLEQAISKAELDAM